MNVPTKITALVENQSKHSNLLSEHGLSFLIECDNKRILFDTGATDLIVTNVSSLGISLGNIDYVVLSHGHHEHTGGLEHMKNK